jgi:hypothetical protein
MAKNNPAKTAQEVKEKYGRKRFNASNAGKSLIYSYIYWGYLKNEGLNNEEIANQPLYSNLNAIIAKVETVNDAHIYNVYMHLQEWLASAFETAVFMRNATNSVIAHFYSIVSSAIAGENLRNTLGEQANAGAIALWLSTLSVDCLRPTKDSYFMVKSLRENIKKGLLYLNVFNTLIAMIAEQTEIPELTLFQVDLTTTKDTIAYLNKALNALREDISKREVMLDEEIKVSISPAFTQKELDTTLEAFRNVSPNAPPIPDDNIIFTKRNISAFVLTGGKAWTNLFTILSKDYWRHY